MKAKLILSSLPALIILFVGAFWSTPSAYANTPISVNSTLDEPDANPGDGNCSSTPSGKCTLRAAIMTANAVPGADTIILPGGIYTLTLSGAGENAAATGDLDINENLTIVGAGMMLTLIDGAGLDRVFDVGPNGATVTLQLSGVTIRNGTAGANSGGGLLVNMGATLSMTNSIISKNAANDLTPLVGGGGIANSGSITLTNVSAISNTAGNVGAGIANFGSVTLVGVSLIGNSVVNVGGGLFNLGDRVTISNSLLANNTAGDFGGAVEHQSGAVSIINSTLSGNTAASDIGGGAIDHNAGTLLVVNSTFAGNSAMGLNAAGAIWSGSALTVVNSTFSANSAGSSGGGAIRMDFGFVTTGTAVITNATFVNNTGGSGGGSIVNNNSAVRLKNSIVSGGSPANCVGPIASQGNNLDSANSCAFVAVGDLKNTNPLLGPLADNGGPALTHALLSGSPAIDAGSNSGCPSTDERGVARPQGSSCDIGAFEFAMAKLFLPLIRR